MKPDLAWLAMAYEAERGTFDRVHRQGPPPPELSPVVMESYLRGCESGFRDALAFEPVCADEPPMELDGIFLIAWRNGYSFGISTGQIYHEMLMERARRQAGINVIRRESGNN